MMPIRIEQYPNNEVDAARGWLTENYPQRVGSEGWDRYDNPFEKKWTWRDKRGFPPNIETLVRWMELNPPQDNARTLVYDMDRHWTGLFVYGPGDKLGLHLDADIHPTTGLRHAATRLLYIGSSPNTGRLEFFEGWQKAAATRNPSAHRQLTVDPAHGLMVTFPNHPLAFHRVTENESTENRYVLTVSYLSSEDPPIDALLRARFVPMVGEYWDVQTTRLAAKRADPATAAEVYRAEV